MNSFYLSITIWLFFYLPAFAGQVPATTTVELNFYSEKIDLSIESTLITDSKVELEESSIKAFYEQMEKRPYQDLIRTLNQSRQQLKLNDWLYYELIHTAAQGLAKHKSTADQTLLSWFLLSKSGFDTRLTYYQEHAFLYAYSDEAIFETPMIEDDGRKFINLSSIHHKMEQSGLALNMLGFVANSGGKPFSFELRQLPALQAQIQEKQMGFEYWKEQFTLTIEVDQTLCEVMKNYPIFAEQLYFEVPLSPSLSNSLFPQLRSILKDRPVKESLEILASFTRSAFTYKEDQEHFGYSKPMIADEVFHYNYSDCEDRSVLFYALVRELLDFPMIIIAFADHLTVGVAPDVPIKGQPIVYQGRDYYICDPTGPKYSNEIGYAPKEYENQRFEILGAYK